MIKWLFEKLPPDWVAQTGWANAQKKTLAWAPGRTERKPIPVRWKYRGYTQLAWPEDAQTMTNQPCLVCWLGIDIDDEPINDDALVWALAPFHGSLRSSCGGVGRHALIRLCPMIPAHDTTASGIIKALLAPVVEAVKASGHKICKADRRLFYVEGGQNQWIYRDDRFYEPVLAEQPARIVPRLSPTPGFQPAQGVGAWLSIFKTAGLLTTVSVRNPIYVGAFVHLLRDMGERVDTKSTMRGNGQVNGWLDVREDYVGLWSYADGHTIWCYQDLHEMGLGG